MNINGDTFRVSWPLIVLSAAVAMSGCMMETRDAPSGPGGWDCLESGDCVVGEEADDEVDRITPSEPKADCVAGDERSCTIELPTHNGVKTCFVGTQVCEDGVWGACE